MFEKAIKSNFALCIVVFLGLVLRLYLAPQGFHNDLLVNASWGEWIYLHGPLGFYSNSVWPLSWPTQPPLISLIYGFNFTVYDKLLLVLSSISLFIALHRIAPTHFLWFFDFVKWFGIAKYQMTDFRIGSLVTMKLLAILADVIIGWVIYKLARPVQKGKSLWWLVLYLFIPFSFYLSSLWGQYDQFGFLFLLIAFLLVLKREFVLSPLMLLISVETKPTSLIFIPVFLYLYFKQKPSLVKIIISFILGATVFITTAVIFADIDIYHFITYQLVQKIFLKSEMRVSTNAFNFWRIFIGDQALNQDTLFVFIPAKVWGYLAFVFLNLISFKLLKKITLENLFKAMFVIGVGSWMFMTNMLDRYLFAGIVSLLILSIYKPSLLKYWVMMSLVFCLNLYNLWFFPQSFLKNFLMWNYYFPTRVLALINLVVFCRVFWEVIAKESIDVFKLPLFKVSLLKARE